MSKANEYNLSHLKKYRKELRNNGTPAEAILWTRLKNKQVKEKRFRRQFSVGNYILDFFCPSAKLAVEVDGDGHFTKEGIEYDARRTTFLETKGIRVIRFKNDEVYHGLDEVIQKIAESLDG